MEEEEGGHTTATDKMVNYVNNKESHATNLRAALDYHSVKEPDLQIISSEGRRLYGHRSVLSLLSPLMRDMIQSQPCCGDAVTTVLLPDTPSEVLSHLLNMIYTGRTEVQGGPRLDLLTTGAEGVFGVAEMLGIEIRQGQRWSVEQLGEIREGAEEVQEKMNESLEKMEICPQIPMFDLGSLLYGGQVEEDQGEEEQVVAPPVENEDFYVCKVASCQLVIMFDNCGARSKILSHYTSHFQREIETSYGHLITAEGQCTLCQKDLAGYQKSKVWSHLGVTHNKTNEVLVSKGIEPVNISRTSGKRKASSDAAPEDSVSSRFEEDQPVPSKDLHIVSAVTYQRSDLEEYHHVSANGKTNMCKICGQVTQNKKRLLKHYCTKHFIDKIGQIESDFIQRNQCVCGRDFVGAKKTSKVIHIGVEHNMIFQILEEEFGPEGTEMASPGKDQPPPKKKLKVMEPGETSTTPLHMTLDSHWDSEHVQMTVPDQTPSKSHHPASTMGVISLGNTPRTSLSTSGEMKEIEKLGNVCIVCGKKFDLFRSMLLPHYCGHFYKEIAMGHEEYFTLENCKLCGAKATKRKSRIIHLGVKHEMVLPYIQKVISSRKEEVGEEKFFEELEELKRRAEELEELKRRADSGVEVIKTEESLILVEEVQEENESKAEDIPLLPIRIPKEEPREENKLENGANIVCTSNKVEEPPKKDKKTLPVLTMKTKTEAWITPNRSKEQILQRRNLQNLNAENQNKSLKLEGLYNDTSAPVKEEDVEEEDEVTVENLGLVCRICEVKEGTDHELLTHYCSHFDTELREIAEEMMDEEHKCRFCKKMLGNNKRRLYHFGVKHLRVIPLINKAIKKNRKTKEENSNNTNGDLVDEVLEEEDDFEITYDEQPTKAVVEHVKQSNALDLMAVQNNTDKGKIDPIPETLEEIFSCGICEKTTKTNRLLNIHLIAVHFKKEILTKFGNSNNVCDICGKDLKNVDGFAFHLGLDHDILNLIMKNRQRNEKVQESLQVTLSVNSKLSEDEEEEMVVDEDIGEEEEEEEEELSLVSRSPSPEQRVGLNTAPESSILKCPLKCSMPLKDHGDLLQHFRIVHGLNDEIIRKVLRSHPQLGSQSKVIEA